ncbi:Uncharacterised protein [Raoultella terrigena]|uniref:Uncharacterized protein n=1 Tax=Raoultella terrigena TaxID=577 RepID=A0A485B7P8_RAOTE|nr:Uncharacterised protein [Raoultella terrigena]
MASTLSPLACFERQRRQLAVSDAAFGHHPVNRQVQLLGNLFNANFWKPSIASSFVFLKGVSGDYRLLTAFDGNVH